MYCHFVKDIISYLRLQYCDLMHLKNVFILYFVCNIILYLVFNSSVVHCPQIFLFLYIYMNLIIVTIIRCHVYMKNI